MDTLDYIFRNLRLTESAIRGIRKKLLRQQKFNKSMTGIVVAAFGYILVNEIELHKYRDRIEDLEKEVEALKGETEM